MVTLNKMSDQVLVNSCVTENDTVIDTNKLSSNSEPVLQSVMDVSHDMVFFNSYMLTSSNPIKKNNVSKKKGPIDHNIFRIGEITILQKSIFN